MRAALALLLAGCVTGDRYLVDHATARPAQRRTLADALDPLPPVAAPSTDEPATPLPAPKRSAAKGILAAGVWLAVLGAVGFTIGVALIEQQPHCGEPFCGFGNVLLGGGFAGIGGVMLALSPLAVLAGVDAYVQPSSGR